MGIIKGLCISEVRGVQKTAVKQAQRISKRVEPTVMTD